jgi:tetratricopeptide (TPR) repeat protein
VLFRSAMRYRDAGKPLSEIARELDVHAVVEGSVLRAGERVRISVQLIEAATDRHLWARRYEREIGDVLGMQGEVAQAIAREIQLQLSPGTRARLQTHRALHPQALEAYLRGRYFWFRRAIPDIRRSITYFERAIQIDPGYADAHAGLADAYCVMGSMHAMPSAEACVRVRESAERALGLDPNLAEAHTSLAYIAGDFEWDWESAERGYLKAIRLNPNYPTAHQWYSSFLGYLGRLEEALVEMQRARELDPMASIIHANNASTLYYARRYAEAEQLVLQALEVTPDFVPLNSELGRIYEQQGRLTEAIEQYRHALKLTGSSEESSPWLGHAFALAGRTAEAREILERVIVRARQEYVSPYAIASVYAGLGDTAPALEWLERAHRERDFTMVFMNGNPRFDRLREEPRFQSLVRKMNFPQ